MKKSTKITLALLATMASAAASGCRREEYDQRRCVDNNNRVVADAQCRPGDRSSVVFINGGYPYRWYYGGTGGGSVGTVVGGGGYQPNPNRTYLNAGSYSSYKSSGGSSIGRSSTSRGGFGSYHGASS